MSSDPSDAIERGRIDLVPMIDCIMLLLLFFILTTTFHDEELGIAQMMPTGQGASGAVAIDPAPRIAIVLLLGDADAALPRFESEREYQQWFDRRIRSDADGFGACELRIGGAPPLLLSGPPLDRIAVGAAMPAHVQRIHDHIARHLAAYEAPGAARADQPEIVIHGFSRLSWRYALLAIDAVRAYEAAHGGVLDPADPAALAQARSLRIAPPRMADRHARTQGAELFELHRIR